MKPKAGISRGVRGDKKTFCGRNVMDIFWNYTMCQSIKKLLVKGTLPSGVRPKARQAWQSLARPGLPGFWPGLPEKYGLEKASQARPRPDFYGHLGNPTLESPALGGLSGQPWQQKPGFPGHVSSMPRFLGFPGQ